MKPAPFTYHRPNSLPEALQLLGEYGDQAKVLGGGQSLGPMLNMRLARPAHLIDLNDLLELDYLREKAGMLEIGALTRHHRLATAPELRRAVPLLSEAAATIGHYAIRQRGTAAGSLVHADPSAQIPLVAVALGADVVVCSVKGVRIVSADAFLQSIMTVDLKPDEMVAALRFPMQKPGSLWAYEMFSRRHGDFAMASVALVFDLDSHGAISDFRFALGGVAAVPARFATLEAWATGQIPNADFRAQFSERAAAAISPEDDVLVPAEYRRDLVRALTDRALSNALHRENVA